MIRVAVFGAMGRMGKEVMKAVRSDVDLELVAAVDPKAGADGRSVYVEGSTVPVSPDRRSLEPVDIDVVVDFTDASAAVDNIRWALSNGIDAVVGTTGIGDEDVREMADLCADTGSNAVLASNFAIGAVLMMKFAEMAAGVFEQCEIIELHHRGKKDAPSGTALATAERICKAIEAKEVPVPESERLEGTRGGAVGPVHIHSVRLDGMVAHQEVLFGSAGETLTVRHDTTDRSCFMPGVIMAVKAVRRRPGLTVGLEPVIGLV